jgi:hypothetical protein
MKPLLRFIKTEIVLAEKPSLGGIGHADVSLEFTIRAYR